MNNVSNTLLDVAMRITKDGYNRRKISYIRKRRD